MFGTGLARDTIARLFFFPLRIKETKDSKESNQIQRGTRFQSCWPGFFCVTAFFTFIVNEKL